MVNKALANKERCYVRNVFSQQLRPCSVPIHNAERPEKHCATIYDDYSKGT